MDDETLTTLTHCSVCMEPHFAGRALKQDSAGVRYFNCDRCGSRNLVTG